MSCVSVQPHVREYVTGLCQSAAQRRVPPRVSDLARGRGGYPGARGADSTESREYHGSDVFRVRRHARLRGYNTYCMSNVNELRVRQARDTHRSRSSGAREGSVDIMQTMMISQFQ